MKYAWIEAQRDRFCVASMCRLVSKSGLYDWRSRPASQRSQDDTRLALEPRALHARHRGKPGRHGVLCAPPIRATPSPWRPPFCSNALWAAAPDRVWLADITYVAT